MYVIKWINYLLAIMILFLIFIEYDLKYILSSLVKYLVILIPMSIFIYFGKKNKKDDYIYDTSLEKNFNQKTIINDILFLLLSIGILMALFFGTKISNIFYLFYFLSLLFIYLFIGIKNMIKNLHT